MPRKKPCRTIDQVNADTLRVFRQIRVPIHDWEMWGTAAKLCGANRIDFIVAACTLAAEVIIADRGDEEEKKLANKTGLKIWLSGQSQSPRGD